MCKWIVALAGLVALLTPLRNDLPQSCTYTCVQVGCHELKIKNLKQYKAYHQGAQR